MAVQLAVLAWMNGSGPSLTDRLLKWDGLYYLHIAEAGYSWRIEVAPDGTLTSGSDLAFHPLLPALAAAVRDVLRVPPETALLLVAAAAGIAASVAVHLLAVEVLGTRRAGFIACALLGVLPMAVTLQMGYAEPVFVALAAAALLSALRGQWWWAAGFCFAAGLTRPSGLVLAVVIPLSACWLARQRAHLPIRRWTVLAASLAGALGVPAYWLALWIRTGEPAAWFEVEKHGWNSHFDFGVQTLTFLHDTLRSPDGFLGPVACAIIIGYLLALVPTVAGRWPYPITAMVTLSVLLALTSTNYWHSRPRLLLNAFVVVLPAAAALSRFRDRTVVLLLCAGTLGSAWFGAYMLTVWRFAI